MQELSEWFVYILWCADDTMYTGCTNNLEKRLQVHNSGKAARYTRVRLPVRIVYTEVCANRSTAQQREAAIKKMTRTQKLQMLTSSDSVS